MDAALYVLLPDCEAVMVQVPAASMRAVVPLTLQMPVVLLVKETASPDEAVAERVNDVSKVRVPGLLNEIVWFCFAGAPLQELKVRVHDEPVDEAR